MIRALTTAATGLGAQSANIERIANDLANVNTDGYKRSRNEFQDLMYETIKEPGGSLGASTQSPVGIQIGMGTKVAAVHKIHEPGTARTTYQPHDLMIEGTGYFPVQKPNGTIAYTRNGGFKLDSQGRLHLTGGSMLIPQITIPPNTQTLTISGSGEVKVLLPNNGEAVIGQLQIVRFQNEEGLKATGAGLYEATAASGAPQQGIPGEDGMGSIQQGMIEGSNVNVANSMVDMITTQRAYEMGTKVMGVVDQMLGATSNIK
jgi:flagellar basal-body rod protein FlgG